MRRLSNILDVLSIRGADCDTAHHVVVATVIGSVAVSKQAAQKFSIERTNLGSQMSWGSGDRCEAS